MEIIKNYINGVECIKFKRLLEYEDYIDHAFITKKGGMEASSNKEKTFEKIAKALNLDKDNFVNIEQKHTDVVQNVDNGIKFFPNCDGSVTKNKNTILVTVTADCIPILIYDTKKNVIANTHSGWKGTVQKISEKTVDKLMNDYNSNPKDLICCFGPCIHKCHFEVDKDVKEIFEKEFKYLNNDDIITKGKNEKYYIDTCLINKLLLEKKGVLEENIIDSGECTVCNSDTMYSYRKDKEKAGRNISIIYLK